MIFRDCGSCHECCNGKVSGSAYGNVFNKDRQCVFMVCEKCTIYKTRPEVCRNYQCAWSQHLLPEWMRPDKTGTLVSIEIDKDDKQFLKVVSNRLSHGCIEALGDFCKNNDTYYEVI